MLGLGRHLIPQELKTTPVYVVGERRKDGAVRYVKHLAVSQYPTWLNDEVLEQTDLIEEAAKFCRREDAEIVAKERCTGRCFCGDRVRVGVVLRLTISGREKDGVTCGVVDCAKPGHDKEWFETMFDVEKVAEFEND